MDFQNKDPFAWPYKDSIVNKYQPEGFEDHFSKTSVPILAKPTDDSISLKESQHILDDIFNLLGEKSQNATQDPLLKDIGTMLETTTSTTENAIITEREASFETIPSDMKYEVSKNSIFSSAVENITNVFENNSDTADESFFNTQTPVEITDGISSEVRSELSFSSPHNRLTEILQETSTTEITELPFYETTKITTVTGLGNTNDTMYGLNSAVNVDLIDLPMKTQSETLGPINNLKEVLSSMQTTKIDPAIMEPIHNPGPISYIPKTEDFFKSSIKAESPFIKGTLMENPINISKTSKANFEDIIDIISTQTEQTTLTSKITEDVNEFSSAVQEITTAASEEVKSIVTEIATAATEKATSAGETGFSEIKLSFNEITTYEPEITTAINDTTNIFTNATKEIVNITKNVTFQPGDFKNVTGGEIADDEGSNSWVFYVILATTVFILLMVIGGVFLFYKKLRPGKGSGYQVSHMKEYSSSTGSENDTNNDKV